jgi:hypothetical protein
MALSVKLRKMEKALKQPCNLAEETLEIKVITVEISELVEAVQLTVNSHS